MKKYLSIENVYKVFVSLAVATILVAILVLSSDVQASNPYSSYSYEDPENKIWDSSEEYEKYVFEQSQFLTRINSPRLVDEFLFLCDHSVYMPTIQNWNKFIENYKSFRDAYRAYKQGFNVEFDDLLN